jgi:hypothetical protein
METMGVASGKGQLRKHIHIALKEWGSPSRKGIEPFFRLAVLRRRGLHRRLRVVEARLTLNMLLKNYIYELGQLQPSIANVLLQRFSEHITTKEIAYNIGASIETVNRMQAAGIRYLADIIWDDELLGESKEDQR